MKYQLINQIDQTLQTYKHVLFNRGIPVQKVQEYLNTTWDDVSDPQALGEQELDLASKWLIQTIEQGGKGVIVVDCDADGYTSSAVLVNYLNKLYPQWISDKLDIFMHQGKQHGLEDAMEFIQEANPKIVIVPDAGSNDTQFCKELYDNGIKVIVLDHHDIDIQNPYAVVINSQSEGYPNKDLSGAGVVWQFCRYLDKKLGVDFANSQLDLVALGLNADMMSLRSLQTKHIMTEGFKDQNLTNPFFFHMTRKNAYSMKNKVTPMTVSFYVAPFINAMTRSGTLQEKHLLFQSMLEHRAFDRLPSTKRGRKPGDTESVVQQAVRIATNVKNRQTKAQNLGMQLIEKKIEKDNLMENKVLLFLLEPGQIDKNIAGLIANKIQSKYQRPVCILTRQEDEQTGQVVYQGSARGNDRIGIQDFKQVCLDSQAVTFCAGHPNAFGIGIKEEDIGKFVQRTNQLLSHISGEPVYYVDYIFQGDNFHQRNILTIGAMQDLWGKDLEQPLVAVQGVRVTPDMINVYIKRNYTLKIRLQNGVSLMMFNAPQELCYQLQNENPGYYQFTFIGKPSRNEWNGNITGQIIIVEYEITDKGYVF